MAAPAKVILMAGAAIGLLLLGYFQGYVHGVTGSVSGELKGILADANKHSENIDARLAHLRGGTKQHVGKLDIVVKEKPFGMHVRRGSSIVEEVFPGFPAERVGVRAGCEVQEISGVQVKQGTWLEIFQKSSIPFKMALNCPPEVNNGHGPMSIDRHNYRVMVVKKPFGMNVQVNAKGNGVPRVVEVLPGSAAEAAGVKRGFVLTAVQDQAVNAETWFEAWQKVALPCTLSFDASIPAHESNPHFANGSALAPANLPEDWDDDEPLPGFEDVSILVEALPFGMQVDSPPGKLPIVKSVVAGLPAEAQGVKAGDVLFKVAGHRVDSSSWFAQFQHSVPPFGVRFRRPDRTLEGGKVPLPVMPVVGELEVMVRERPFGMNVHRGTHTVKEVFSGFPAQKLGVRKGCEIRQIAGKFVSQGTWMELIQHTPLPFSLKLFCAKKASSSKKNSKGGQPPLSKDEHNFKVLVKERPFGMNVQVNEKGNGVPRVVEVLPGYPAEAVGVKAGFVLTAINDQPVRADTWLDAWQASSVGAVLTFDTNMPLHATNSLLNEDAEKQQKMDPPGIDEGSFTDFRCAVRKLPFGFEVVTPTGGRPTVKKVVVGSPAEVAGVKAGDVMIEVAGLPVDTSSWFKAFQQAAPPFGLHFRRPVPLPPLSLDASAANPQQ